MRRLNSAFLTCAAVTLSALAIGYRRRFCDLLLNWGATPDEKQACLPGDTLAPAPFLQSTRAVTIAAPAAAVWPWLAQLGQDRGGTYGYTSLENLLRFDSVAVSWLIPRFQEPAPGEVVWMAPGDRYGGAYAVVACCEPRQALVLALPPWLRAPSPGTFNARQPARSWSFILRQQEASGTRLLVRRRHTSRHPVERLAACLLEPANFLMERHLLLTVKANAEAARHETANGRAPLGCRA